ncbi:MAG: MotA/TolQ/ExbB proton channel family protein [Rhodocyclales bacterium]|nr:MotA/TolQ/ExbB proton channel family protein [Rhodocyclales bacterium]
MSPETFGLAHLWAQGDAVTHGVALLLLAMSVASWYWILARGWAWLRLRRSAGAVDAFWEASGFAAGLESLQQAAAGTPACRLAESAVAAARHFDERGAQLAGALDRGEFLTRALRQSIARSQAALERGLTLLATIGATAPFVGLFGTVWGIYHALVAISVSGQATLDKVAGPVGEALIMTAAGIGVALPAVAAYNAITRANRVVLGDLDAFAHDLHAFLTTGARLDAPAPRSALRIAAAQPAGAH